MNEKLFRPEFHQMETAEKQALMERLAARYAMAFLGLQSFDRWGQSCATGVFEKDGREFVFVPGDTVTLGWDHFAAGLDPDSREELDELFREWEIEQSPEALIRESMAPVRQATIGPMLVGRKLEELCWEPVKMNDPRVTAHPDWLKKFRDFAWSDLESLTLHQSARIERMKSGFQIWIYNRTDYDTLLAGLEQQGFSLPTADEWAYLCGGGCRTLFPWGDGVDYSMHHADGAVAGFFCYPLDTLREEERSEKIFAFRDKLEEVFITGDGPEILTLTGGATGLFCGYVDFIAWDIRAVLQKAKEFFEGTDIPWASFHTFRREAGTVALKKPPEKEPEDEDAPALIRQCQDEIDKQTEAADEDESDTDRTGVFTGFVLLSKGEWDKQQFIRDMQEKWGITVDEYSASEEKDDDALVFEVGDMLAAVSLADCPIPAGEAEANAENNYMWEDAVKVAREHRAHILVAVLGKEKDLLEKGKLFTKVVAVCCRQKYATGVYTSGVVFEPQFYEGFADMLKEDKLPIFNWIWFGLWRNEKGLNGYTYGMEAFGKDEMEVLDTNADPYDLLDFLASLASYVLENDVELHDGETIGFTADDKRAITRSPGVGLPEEQMTLKISWEPGSGDPDGSGENDPDGEKGP